MIILNEQGDLVGRKIESYFLIKLNDSADSYLVFQTKDKSILVQEINTVNNTLTELEKADAIKVILSAQQELLERKLITEEDIKNLTNNLRNEIIQKEKEAQAKAERYHKYLEYMKEFDPESYSKIVAQDNRTVLSKEQKNLLKNNLEHILRGNNVFVVEL